MTNKHQSSRLTSQHKKSQGVVGIFGAKAHIHDTSVGKVSDLVLKRLQADFPHLSFRYRTHIDKAEINQALQRMDQKLGNTLFVADSNIKPDGGIIEVKDRQNTWRVVLISEAKFQGKDIENIQNGKLVGKNSNKDLMLAGNAIERAHKNIAEFANYMLGESYFPYVLFLEGSNFLTRTITVKRPDGRKVTLDYTSGFLNRLDRLTAANYGMSINTNLCENKFIKNQGRMIMLQAASIFTPGNGKRWKETEMFRIMLDIAKTSVRVLGNDLLSTVTK
ncbi:MAG: hypothetical protein IJ876_05975 [Elusimicrobiaceae bacterium]|nr:hypothetical protein [Elusimicrobiaceae bacterium]